MSDKIGAMRERVKIYRLETTPDGYGGLEKSFTLLGETWAEAKVLSGNEVFNAGAVLTTERVVFRIRYWEEVNNTCMVEWKGKRYNILHLVIEPGQTFMELQCELAHEVENA